MDQTGHTPGPAAKARRGAVLSVEDYTDGVLAGQRGILARAITLIESKSPAHERQAQEVLQRLLPHTGKSKRIGITGVPGVGKSTFIEAFGCFLVEHGHKVAVLTIDPSSTKTHGSILGDKTRMERLSREPNAYIRPSPAGESLGGVSRRTREALLVCEAAGFDTIIIETVGVGQSEVELRSMVDFFLLLLLPGAGDELQGIKKGIIEMADAVLINKADGENRVRAQQALAETDGALHYLQPATPGWKTEVAWCSGLTGEGIPHLWAVIERFYKQMELVGVIAKRRKEQALDWMSALVRDELLKRFHDSTSVKARLPELQQAVLRGETTPVLAAKTLLDTFNQTSTGDSVPNT